MGRAHQLDLAAGQDRVRLGGAAEKTAFRLERVSFRLERLQALHDRGVGQGTIDGGESTKVFFAQIARERSDVNKKLALTRWVTKQYLKRNEGRLP